MNGKKARKIRKQVYGDLSPRNKEYTSSGDIYSKGNLHSGILAADEKRQEYQKAKGRP